MSSPQPPADGPSTPPPAMPDLSDLIADPGRPPKPANQRTRLYALGGIAALVLLGAGFGIGHATASSGPSTLAAAVAEAQAGKLPCGTPSGSTIGTTGGTSGGTSGSGAAGGGQGGFARGGGASFLIARLCSNANAGTGDTGGRGGGFGGGFAGGTGLGSLFGPGAVNGTITSISGKAITLQTRAGAITIDMPAAAKVTRTTSGSLKDLSNGLPVEVSTTQDSAGNRTATSIFVLPARTTGLTG